MFSNSINHNTVVVLGTYNRGHLLQRSLKLYEKQDALLIILDDDSNDDTYHICQSSPCPICYIQLPPKNGKWRDSSCFLNKGISVAIHTFKAEYIFITHPEIIPGLATISCCKQLAADSSTWVNAKGYYLTPSQQQIIDTVRWELNPLSVRQLPGFYDLPSESQNKDYTPAAIDETDVWGSWIFGGGTAHMWRQFGGLTEFEIWGSVDVDLLNRRVHLGMHTVTPKAEDAIVIHQNHDDPTINIITPRDMEKCMAALPDYRIEDARKPHLISEERWLLK